jgi:hypothetical protein
MRETRLEVAHERGDYYQLVYLPPTKEHTDRPAQQVAAAVSKLVPKEAARAVNAQHENSLKSVRASNFAEHVKRRWTAHIPKNIEQVMIENRVKRRVFERCPTQARLLSSSQKCQTDRVNASHLQVLGSEPWSRRWNGASDRIRRVAERTEKTSCCECNRSLSVYPLHLILKYQSGTVP